MLAIWGICVEIAQSRLADNQSVRMLDQKLKNNLFQSFLDCIMEIEMSCPDAGQLILKLELEAKNQLFRDKHPLNVFAEIFQHYGSLKSNKLSDLSDELSEIVDQWAKKNVEFVENSGISSLKWFIERARGRTSDGVSIRWNSNLRCFENVDWSLALTKKKSLPSSAIAIEHSNCLQQLKHIAFECRYTIKENRSHMSRQYFLHDDYFCTLEVSDSNTTKPLVTVWQKPGYMRTFWLVIEHEENKLSEPMQKWIKLRRIVSDIGEFEEV